MEIEAHFGFACFISFLAGWVWQAAAAVRAQPKPSTGTPAGDFDDYRERHGQLTSLTRSLLR